MDYHPKSLGLFPGKIWIIKIRIEKLLPYDFGNLSCRGSICDLQEWMGVLVALAYMYRGHVFRGPPINDLCGRQNVTCANGLA